MWECGNVGTSGHRVFLIFRVECELPPHQREKKLWIGIVSVSEKWETEKQGKKSAFFVFVFFSLKLWVGVE